jgi:hypothetical protein
MSEKPLRRDRKRKAAAARALAEAEERRKARAGTGGAPGQKEAGGRGGPDPVRYGDWEKDGIISDF